MQKAILKFLDNKIEEFENGYAHNYVALMELDVTKDTSAKALQNREACKLNMDKALKAIERYEGFKKQVSAPKKK